MNATAAKIVPETPPPAAPDPEAWALILRLETERVAAELEYQKAAARARDLRLKHDELRDRRDRLIGSAAAGMPLYDGLAWRSAALAELGLPLRTVTALEPLGCRNVGELADRIEARGPAGWWSQLLSAAEADRVVEAVARFKAAGAPVPKLHAAEA